MPNICAVKVLAVISLDDIKSLRLVSKGALCWVGDVVERLRLTHVTRRLAGRFPKLLELDLTGCPMSCVDSTVLDSVGALTALTRLAFKRPCQSRAVRHLVGLKWLRSLQLQASADLDMSDWMLLSSRHFPALDSLDLTGASQLLDGHLVALAANMPRLRCLSLHLCSSVTPAALPALSQLTALTSLNLQNIRCMSDASVAACGPLPALRRLQLAYNVELRDMGPGELRPDRLRLLWPVLEHLNCAGCTRLTDAAAAAVGQLTRLTTLCLDDCDGLTDRGLTQLLRLPHLCSLSMRACVGVRGTAFAAAAAVAPLEHVDLSHCTQLRNSSLPGIAAHGTLQSLHLAGCAGIGDSGCQHLSTLTRLSALDVAGCRSITRASIDSLAALTRLADLSIACSGILGTALAPLASLSALRRLNVAGLRELGDAALPTLQQLSQLTSLDIGLTGVTAAGLDQLVAMPSLVLINHYSCDRMPRSTSVPAVCLQSVAKRAHNLVPVMVRM